MPFQRIIEHLRYSPWFCTAPSYMAMSDVVEACLKRVGTGASMDVKAEGFSLSDMQSRKEMKIDSSGIAHIHVLGVLGRGLSPIEKCCGRTDYGDLENEAMQAQRVARAAAFEFDT